MAYLEQPKAAIESYAEAIDKLTEWRDTRWNNEADYAYYSSQLAQVW